MKRYEIEGERDEKISEREREREREID